MKKTISLTMIAPSRTLVRVAIRLASFIAIVVTGVPALLAQQKTDTPMFTLLTPEQSGIQFINSLIEDEQFNINTFIYAYNGGGVAVGDINGDNLPDIYFSGTQAHSPSRLYLNKGNLHFEDISESAGVLDTVGVRYGVVMVDIDGDGDLDIYASKQNYPNRLYINNGDLTFTDKAAAFGLNFCCSSTQAAFFDFDRDGDLDMYLGVNGEATGRDYTQKGLTDHLFVNNGNNTFTDVAKTAGIRDNGYALSVSVGDVNNDGWMDVYITNDFEARDILYINNHDGTFSESTKASIRHTTEFGMGSDVDDFNNDGMLDIVAVDMLPEDHWRKMSNMGSQSIYSPLFDSTQQMRNTLQLNRGNGLFSDIGQLAGISETDWSWSPLFADYDLDGDKDLYITNGYKRDIANLDVVRNFSRSSPAMQMLKHIPPLRLQNYMFMNNDDLTFKKVGLQWGIADVVNSNGASYADLDLDGDLDIIVNNLDTVAFVYRNNAIEKGLGNYLVLTLKGNKKNTKGIGARVTIRHNGKTQTKEFSATRGYLSSTDYIVHFGLGQDKVVDRLTVIWPDGAGQVLENVSANQRLELDKSNASSGVATPHQTAIDANQAASFQEVSSETGLDMRHTENVYNDFNRERLLPNKLSRNGPGIAIGDIDKNDLDDIYIGGAANSPGQLYLQIESGRFQRSTDTLVFSVDAASEDMGAIFLDVENDGDLDLYVVSGGNEFQAGDPLLQDRLYLNDGKGGFTKSHDALPEMNTSGCTVIAADYDDDGDMDLFVGGRVVPSQYPDAPRSYILNNTNGTFTDVTATIALGLVQPGMVTSALWTDYDNDGDPDIMLTGEWMGIRFYNNAKGKFTDVSASTGLDSNNGWWNSITGGDFDNDGDIDYVLGNLGLNTKSTRRASKAYPLNLYVNDFDGNNSRDLVMTYFYQGYEFPARHKSDVTPQMPSYISRKFPTFTQYSSSRIEQIYPKEKLDSAIKFSVMNLANSYVENLGNGKFLIRRLPVLAQESPIYGTVVEDFNADGNLDILALENFAGPDGDVIRYDAGYSLYLLGDGTGNFTPVPLDASGFCNKSDGRSVAVVNIGADNSSLVIAVNNNDYPKVFKHLYPENARIVPIARAHNYTHALIALSNGKTRKQEFYTGGGYISQSSCSVVGSPNVSSVMLYKGKNVIQSIEKQLLGGK